MASNNNIFYATNPARILDALWDLIVKSGIDLSDMLIFLLKGTLPQPLRENIKIRHSRAENIYFSWVLGVGPMYLIGLPILLLITRNMQTKKRERQKLHLL